MDFRIPGISQSPSEISEAIKSHASGMIKGNTADFAGLPVDVINMIISPATKALGIHTDDPFGGSKTFRRLLNQSVKDANAAETVGSMISIGGAAKAMLVGAARLGKIDSRIKPLDAERMLSPAIGEANSVTYDTTGVFRDKDKILKAVISDADVKLNLSAFENVGGQLVPKYSPETGPVKLSEALTGAEKHFTLYPELKNTVLREELFGGGSVSRDNKVMTVQPFVATKTGIDAARGIILHEVQHVVQHAEGAGRGGNTAQFLPANHEAVKSKIQQKLLTAPANSSQAEAGNRYLFKLENAEEEARMRYLNLPGEQEARFTQINRNASESELSDKVLRMLTEGDTPQTYDTRPIRSLFTESK